MVCEIESIDGDIDQKEMKVQGTAKRTAAGTKSGGEGPG